MAFSLPFPTFTDGTVADGAQVTANNTSITNQFNALPVLNLPLNIASGGTGGTSAQQALTSLGLSTGTIIPATASSSGSTISLVGSAGTPLVSTYAFGTGYLFQSPANISAPIYIQDTTTSGSGLGPVILFGTSSLSAGQVCFVEIVSTVFVLMNPPAPVASGARFQYFSATGTLVVPTGITTMYATGCAAGGAGGSCSGTASAGGGGGGAGSAVQRQAFSTIPGHLLAVTINASQTSIVDSTTATNIIILNAGSAGANGTTGSPTTGGSAGGAGGQAGGSGQFFATAPLSESGAGGGGLFGGGGSTVSSGGGSANNGVAGSGYGAGGSGGAGSSAAGGAGSPGNMLLEW